MRGLVDWYQLEQKSQLREVNHKDELEASRRRGLYRGRRQPVGGTHRVLMH
jgi:hypothetical protein